MAHAVTCRLMAQESTAEIPARDIERYHAAAVELAEESRRIVRPALERGFAVETKVFGKPTVVDSLVAVFGESRSLV